MSLLSENFHFQRVSCSGLKLNSGFLQLVNSGIRPMKAVSRTKSDSSKSVTSCGINTCKVRIYTYHSSWSESHYSIRASTAAKVNPCRRYLKPRNRLKLSSLFWLMRGVFQLWNSTKRCALYSPIYVTTSHEYMYSMILYCTRTYGLNIYLKVLLFSFPNAEKFD